MLVISYNQRYPTWVWLEMVYMTPLMRKCRYSKSCVPIFLDTATATSEKDGKQIHVQSPRSLASLFQG